MSRSYFKPINPSLSHPSWMIAMGFVRAACTGTRKLALGQPDDRNLEGEVH
jgi:hypothetical protein